MTFVRPKARILELSTTSGSGPFALAGAADGSYNRFSAFMSVGDTTYATVVEPAAAFWTGIVTYSATNQITLTTVEETKGTFGAGNKEIFAGALASTSMFREDIAGAIVTTGTSTAYVVASYRKYDSLVTLNGNIIAFTPHVANGAGAQLSVDGNTSKPLMLAPGVPVQSNVLIPGTPYTALYNNTDGAFYLHSLGGNAYGIPLAAGIDYWAATTPSSAYAFPVGQAISRTAYAALFALIGTQYGVGDGSTTFNLPDKSGRGSVMKEASASRLTSTYFGGNSTVLGAVGGSESHTLTLGETPTGITSGGSNSISVGSPVSGFPLIPVAAGGTGPISQIEPAGVQPTGTGRLPYASGASPGSTGIWSQTTSFSGSNSIAVTSNNTGGNPHAVVQPTIVCNYIMRVI